MLFSGPPLSTAGMWAVILIEMLAPVRDVRIYAVSVSAASSIRKFVTKCSDISQSACAVVGRYVLTYWAGIMPV
jgi:hypothetical protein